MDENPKIFSAFFGRILNFFEVAHSACSYCFGASARQFFAANPNMSGLNTSRGLMLPFLALVVMASVVSGFQRPLVLAQQHRNLPGTTSRTSTTLRFWSSCWKPATAESTRFSRTTDGSSDRAAYAPTQRVTPARQKMARMLATTMIPPVTRIRRDSPQTAPAVVQPAMNASRMPIELVSTHSEWRPL